MAVAVDQFRGVIDRGFCRHLEPGMCAVATTSSCRELLATCTSRQADRGPGTVAVTRMVADTLLAPQAIASANPHDEYQLPSSTTRTRSGTYPAV